MDFILDSDSDSAYSPHIKSRIPVKSSISKVITNSFQQTLKPRDAPSSLKADLMDAYQKLETPKMASRVADRRNDFDASRERMKLANIIDSETNGDDTDNLFLLPITMQSLEEYEKNTAKRNEKAAPFQKSFDLELNAARKSERTSLSQKPLDLELSGISDAEDLLSEFTTSKTRPNYDSNCGKLLQVDSNSEQTTPKIKAIRDELDQSKTRFRQSITELLNSSPISAGTLDKAPDFKDLVKMGSKLSERVYSDLEAVEKNRPSSFVIRTNPIQPSSPIQPLKKLSTEELLNLSPTTEAPTEQAVLEEGETSNFRIFMGRVLWALFVIGFIFAMDLVLQVVATRQQSGLPIFEYGPAEKWLNDLTEKVTLWISSWNAIILPH